MVSVLNERVIDNACPWRQQSPRCEHWPRNSFYHLVCCYFSIGKQGLGKGSPGKGKAWEEGMKRLPTPFPGLHTNFSVPRLKKGRQTVKWQSRVD